LLHNLEVFLKDVKRLVVIGIGNELRADDAVGLEVARQLKPYEGDKLVVFEGQMTPDVVISPTCRAHPSHVLFIDAAELHKTPGAWQMITEDDVERGFFSTHSLPMKDIAVELQRRCNAHALFLGIQPKSRDISLVRSKECQNAAMEIATRIRKCLGI
jgi:hydrogenase 3 maturation protease